MSSHSPFITEGRLSSIAVTVASSSAFLVALLFFFSLGVVDVGSRKLGIASSPYFVAASLGLAGYALSIYLVQTAPRSPFKRKVASWTLSVAFHASVIAYFAVALSSVQLAIVLLLSETLVVLVSLVGLSFVIRQRTSAQAA